MAPPKPVTRSLELPINREFGEDLDNAQLRATFNDEVDEAMKIPDAYDKVAVLLIYWVKELDDMNCEPEVGQLDDVFSTRYHYQTHSLKLHNRTNPQNQLNSGIAAFVAANDGRHNLLIVYYAGHGAWCEKKSVLYLEAARNKAVTRNSHPAKAEWNAAETSLVVGPEADVLTILDCCYAGNIERSTNNGGRRAYEVLAAGAPGVMTQQPGEHSFTNALISVLKVVTDTEKNRINTFDLHTRIGRERDNRHQPKLYNRMQSFDPDSHDNGHIRLSPLTRLLDDGVEEYRTPEPKDIAAWDFSISFSVSGKPTEGQVKHLAVLLPGIFKEAFNQSEIRLCRARWRPKVSPSVELAAKKLKGLLERVKRPRTESIESGPGTIADVEAVRILRKGVAEGVVGSPPPNSQDVQRSSVDKWEFPNQIPPQFEINDEVKIEEEDGDVKREANYKVVARQLHYQRWWYYQLRKDDGISKDLYRNGAWVDEGLIWER
ncbi:MAG: hypothetical protein M1839_000012 [Geoglossum umbratile]|nr:MAG: hypothetical protein M1839_000012 [Geoglossum umbratile]